MDIKQVVTSVATDCTCEVCGIKFYAKKPNAIYCSTPCRQKGSNEKTRLQNQVKFLAEHGEDPLMPVCKECGWKAFDLITHITKFHKIPMKEYYAKHKCDSTETFHPEQMQERSDRISGEKNPGFDHKGTMSAVSRNNKKYEGMSEEAITSAIKDVQAKQSIGREEGGGYTTRIEYWTRKGFSREEAITKVQHRQRTFSRDICIEKYGEEKGIQVFEARQKLWLDSLYGNMTDEEYKELTRRKTETLRRGWSMVAYALFNELDHPDAIYASPNSDTEGYIVMNDGTEFTYPVDYMLGNKVIEFYGDQIHGNPKFFKPDDETKGIITYVAQYVWDRDARKQKIITDSGYDLLVVWEHDFKYNTVETIQRCKDFLGI